MATRPIPQLTEKDKARFWDKVDKEGPLPKHRPELGPCWVWTAGRNAKGYGTYGVRNVTYLASRISIVIENGCISEELCALHHCDNPSCIRPLHLFTGTKQDNTQDMLRKGRESAKTKPERIPRGATHRATYDPSYLKRGESHYNTHLTEDDVREIRRLKSETKMSAEKIGRSYGVTGANILFIYRRKSWAHVV